jgi:hypothetical protein
VALGVREMNQNSFRAQEYAFSNDRAVNVRLEILKNLWKARERFPEVYRLLRQAAAKDTSKEVRQAAREVMATDSSNTKDK